MHKHRSAFAARSERRVWHVEAARASRSRSAQLKTSKRLRARPRARATPGPAAAEPRHGGGTCRTRGPSGPRRPRVRPGTPEYSILCFVRRHQRIQSKRCYTYYMSERINSVLWQAIANQTITVLDDPALLHALQTCRTTQLHMAHFQLGSFLIGLGSDWAQL